MIGNKEILGVAVSFHKVADAALEKHIEYGEILPAYIANAAFAAELYLKSLAAAESSERVIFEVGSAKIREKFVNKSIYGHLLSTIFNQLPARIKHELENGYCESRWNLNLTSLSEELESWSLNKNESKKSVFELSRYSYEGNFISVDYAERLRCLLLFLSESIKH